MSSGRNGVWVALAWVTGCLWYMGLIGVGGGDVTAPGLIVLLVCWPIGLWVPALFAAMPAVFQPWSAEAKLRRRINAAKAEQRMIALRKEVEAEEAKANAAVEAFIESA